MPNSWFRFKHFTIEQSGAAMKVGTDGVLLGAWLRVERPFMRYLDIGTGTGLIALMAAQRVSDLGNIENVCIDAVEADVEAATQAQANVAVSLWADIITVHAVSLQRFAERAEAAYLYDHIFSNPPWFVGDLESPCEKRTAARHTSQLTYGELLECTCRMLKKGGVLSVIMPVANGGMFESEAIKYDMVLSRRTMVRTTPESTPKRVLMEFTRVCASAVIEDELTIETSQAGCYTEQYRNLTRDFYLKF